MKLIRCTSETEWKHTALDWLQTAIHSQLAETSPLTLALCGGETPWPLFKQALDDNQLPWDQLQLVPTDERWVDLDSDRSNEGRLKTIFENTAATVSGFRSVADNQEGALAYWSQHKAALPKVALLGMGGDGHFASIFTEADYQQEGVVFTTENAGEPRISWSRETLESTPELAIFIRGEAKLRVLDEGIGVVHHLLSNRPDTHVFWVA